MKCPTIDELSQYVDELLSEQKSKELHEHVKSCGECQLVVEAFQGEQQFLKETLQTPSLPDDFASLVLGQLEPYEQNIKQKKKSPLKRILLTAAGLVLAVGLSASLNPSFANWIGGMFSLDAADSMADDGLKQAAEGGLVERVDLEVTDNGITFKVEDVVSDTSRIALSYQILNAKGKPLDSNFDWNEGENEILVLREDGAHIDAIGSGWQEGSKYGLIDVSLKGQEVAEKLTINFNLVELNGVAGNWQLEIPVDLKKHRDLTMVVPLNGAETINYDVLLRLNEAQFAPSSTELLYKTSFTEEKLGMIENEVQKLEQQFGAGIVESSLANYGTAIRYHIENEEGKTIYHHHYGTSFTGENDSVESYQYEGLGNDGVQLGAMDWHDSFIPQKQKEKLKFVLDGVYKTEPSDFSVTFNPKDLKKNPVSFDYEGNFITIHKARENSEYFFRKSMLPLRKETSILIEMKGGTEALASDIGSWILVDDKGIAYPTYGSGSKLKEQDQNGRYKTETRLQIYDLDEIPDELTLRLVSVTRYEELKEKWAIPLYED